MSNGRSFKRSRSARQVVQRKRKQQAKAARGFQRAFSAAASVVTQVDDTSFSVDGDAMWPGALTVLAGGEDPTPEDIRQVAKEYADADADRG